MSQTLERHRLRFDPDRGATMNTRAASSHTGAGTDAAGPPSGGVTFPQPTVIYLRAQMATMTADGLRQWQMFARRNGVAWPTEMTEVRAAIVAAEQKEAAQ